MKSDHIETKNTMADEIRKALAHCHDNAADILIYSKQLCNYSSEVEEMPEPNCAPPDFGSHVIGSLSALSYQLKKILTNLERFGS